MVKEIGDSCILIEDYGSSMLERPTVLESKLHARLELEIYPRIRVTVA